MSDLLNKLVDQRLRAVEQMREIADREEPNEEDNTTYERASNDVTRLGKLIEDERKNADGDRAIEESMKAATRNAGMRGDVSNDDGDDDGDGNDDPRNVWLREARAAIGEKRQSRGGAIETLPDMRQFLYNRYRNGGFETRDDPPVDPDTYTMAKNNVTRGPEVIPETLVNRLFSKLFDDSTILQQGVEIMRTTDGNKIKFPRLVSLGVQEQSKVRRAEREKITFTAPELDQVELDAYKYGEGSMASREVIEDAVIDIQGLLGTTLGRRMANYLGYDLLLGDGTGDPRGIVQICKDNAVVGGTGVNTVVGTNAAGGLGGTAETPVDEYDEIRDLEHALLPAYRRRAKFLVNDASVGVLRKIKAGDADFRNTYIWQPGTATEPDTLDGYPLAVDPFMPDFGNDEHSIVFADFSMFTVRLVNGVRVEWSTEYAWDTDQVAVKAILRADSDTVDDAAFASFKGATGGI